MKSKLFQYVRAESTQEVVSLLGELGEDAQILAGGQSLVPAMALRMASPEILIDISSIEELQSIELVDGLLKIGAGCLYADILESALVVKSAPLLTQAIPFIAHEAIRNRGTIGGSLALADPAAELPACMLALDSVIVLKSHEGTRKVPAPEFFLGTYFTAILDTEMIVAVEIPTISKNQCHGFLEISRRSGDYAIAGGAFVVELEAERVISAQMAYFSVGDRPVLAPEAALLLTGSELSDEVIRKVGAHAAEEIEFLADLYNGVSTKKQITKTLTRRLLTQISKKVT
ncbi:MAG: xanthine dehydrogenase family protein subunit M [Rhodobacteraceae bacterium]|nr:xanthine dehydrogenase family protein subunit M [Paracoccaceae bacterium]